MTYPMSAYLSFIAVIQRHAHRRGISCIVTPPIGIIVPQHDKNGHRMDEWKNCISYNGKNLEKTDRVVSIDNSHLRDLAPKSVSRRLTSNCVKHIKISKEVDFWLEDSEFLLAILIIHSCSVLDEFRSM